jgi:hypothetical protein
MTFWAFDSQKWKYLEISPMLATGQPSRWSPVVLDLVSFRPKSWEIGLQRGWNMIWLVVYLPLVRNMLFIYG